MVSSTDIIRRLDLAPHPEGGWYRETWRAETPLGEREAGTSILFLLEAGQRSHWHRVDAAEIWLYHAGDPLLLHIAGDDDRRSIRLGPDIIGGDALQAVVPPHAWQAAEPLGAWTLCACVVVPAFRFEGFELAPDGWEPE